jgi:hypothetical protein
MLCMLEMRQLAGNIRLNYMNVDCSGLLVVCSCRNDCLDFDDPRKQVEDFYVSFRKN